jgi:hypothetical protein
MTMETNWTQVVDQLKVKTDSQSLLWEEGGLLGNVGTLVASALLRSNRARTFTAKVGKAAYELSAGDPFGSGPYELKIWEERDGRRRAVTALNSKVRALSDPLLGHALEELYRTVDMIVESEQDTAARLLRDLENL